MEIGNKIKKYREHINMSQEQLADKVYVSRQTVSNWENNKSYPDINSLKLLRNIFDVSLDEFIKGDIEEMKKRINDYDLKEYNTLSIIFSVEFLLMLVSAYPLLRFLEIFGIIIWVLIAILTLYTGIKIEKIYKRNDCRTYKEIVAFTEGKPLSTKEQIEEKAKRPYQKFLLGLFSGLIAIIVFIMLELIFR
ncbi:MAG: helix-turn-helix transcriptional regulator [Bacilli bacterium]|nr:helix-turn-helix transcriptional regulator [Bacilli bacterium]